MEKVSNFHKRMFENIYDLIRGGTFEQQSKKEIRAFIKNKNIEWDGYNTITLGRHFVISLSIK